MLGLCGYSGFSLVVEVGASLAAVFGLLLIAVAYLVAEHSLEGAWVSVLVTRGSVFAAPRPQSTGSVAVAHGLGCSAACGIFLGQGSNPCLLHWQVDSLPPSHQRSPTNILFNILEIIHLEINVRVKWGRQRMRWLDGITD